MRRCRVPFQGRSGPTYRISNGALSELRRGQGWRTSSAPREIMVPTANSINFLAVNRRPNISTRAHHVSKLPRDRLTNSTSSPGSVDAEHGDVTPIHARLVGVLFTDDAGDCVGSFVCGGGGGRWWWWVDLGKCVERWVIS